MATIIFGDTACMEEMAVMARNPVIKGFTSNPSSMKKAAVNTYIRWATNICNAYPQHDLSFEVIADDFREMERQARIISSWGDNVYVKIPVMNTLGNPSYDLIRALSFDGIKVNVTAVMTRAQINDVMGALGDTPAIVSVFAGRIADTGRNPVSTIEYAISKKVCVNTRVLWASPRQVLDVYTCGSMGCDIITITKDLFVKLKLEGKNLTDYSKETVRMFFDDACAAGYVL